MCRIALINGSPKRGESASQCILDELAKALSKYPGCTLSTYSIHDRQVRDGKKILDNDRLVFAFPLYVDGPPSHLISGLMELETLKSEAKRGITVYAVVNCGFFEGKQAETALAILENWCVLSGFRWGQGLGIGGGGMLQAIQGVPPGRGPRRNISLRINGLAAYIQGGNLAANEYASPNFPRFLYRALAQMGWRRQAKRFGVKPKQLAARR